MLVTQTPLTASQSTQYRQYRQYRHSVQAVRVPSCLQNLSIFEEAPLRYILHWPKTVSVIFLTQYCTPQKYFLQFCGSFRRHYLDLFCTLRHIPPRLCGLRQLLGSRNSRCSSSRAEDSGSENMKWMKVKSGGATIIINAIIINTLLGSNKTLLLLPVSQSHKAPTRLRNGEADTMVKRDGRVG